MLIIAGVNIIPTTN